MVAVVIVVAVVVLIGIPLHDRGFKMHRHSFMKGFLYGSVGLSVQRSARPFHEIVFHISL